MNYEEQIAGLDKTLARLRAIKTELIDLKTELPKPTLSKMEE